MAPRLIMSGLLATASYILPAAAQLSGTVGPTTTTASKAATKVCNIMDYGGVADATTDNSDAITAAWTACIDGGEVYIPAGDYGLENWVTLSKGSGVSINLEGVIYRTGTAEGNMIGIEHSTDIEVYSATSAGAIQAYGYEFHKDGEYGARILRCSYCENFSIHDLILVDAPMFHLSLDTCTNGEVYNMIIHGGYEGGLDGIDVWGTNIWIHDIEVSNKDECVTIKDPATNILVEQVHCNWSGGCSMGSLSSGVAISDIEYNYIYTHDSNQMYMVKSNGGNGTVQNVALNNFMGHSNAYTLDFDTAWESMAVVAGDGIEYSNFTFSGWTGTCTDGTERGPVKMNCPADVPCDDFVIEDFHVGTEEGTEILYGCQNAYGSGACLASGDANDEYTSTQTIATATSTAYSTMDNELSTGYDISSSIPIPSMPASFFPGRAPISAFASDSAAATTTAAAASSSSATVHSAAGAVSASSAASSSAQSGAVASSSQAIASSSQAIASSSQAVATESAKTSSAASEQPTPGGRGNRGGSGHNHRESDRADEAEVTAAPCKRSVKFNS